MGTVAVLATKHIHRSHVDRTQEMLKDLSTADAVAAVVIYQTSDGVVTVKGEGISVMNSRAFAGAMAESATSIARLQQGERRLPPGVSVE